MPACAPNSPDEQASPETKAHAMQKKSKTPADPGSIGSIKLRPLSYRAHEKPESVAAPEFYPATPYWGQQDEKRTVRTHPQYYQGVIINYLRRQSPSRACSPFLNNSALAPLREMICPRNHSHTHTNDVLFSSNRTSPQYSCRDGTMGEAEPIYENREKSVIFQFVIINTTARTAMMTTITTNAGGILLARTMYPRQPQSLTGIKPSLR